MDLLERFAQAFKRGAIKPKDTFQDWMDSLEDEDFDQLERLITLHEEYPQREEVGVIGQLVTAVYALETGEIELDVAARIRVVEMEEDLFFKMTNSFLFLLTFYYWLKQGLLETNTKLSLLANMENKITITLKEYGK